MTNAPNYTIFTEFVWSEGGGRKLEQLQKIKMADRCRNSKLEWRKTSAEERRSAVLGALGLCYSSAVILSRSPLA